jgi:putative ABC transport system substrate-binding protein
MRRRDFISLVGGAAAWPIAARAQQRPLPVIGALITPSQAEFADRVEAFRRGLTEAGFAEGRDVAIEYRWADNQLDRLPALIADLVGRRVAAIFVTGDSIVAVPKLKAATQTIPIVFTTGSDPVAMGMVASLNRPGGNVTGVTSITTELGGKHLELLHEMMPGETRIGMLVNTSNPAGIEGMTEIIQAAAKRLGLAIAIIGAGTNDEIDRAFADLVRQQIRALVVGQDAYFQARREQVAALAMRARVATISGTRRSPEAGGLMSYGSAEDVTRQAGFYVGRILKGAKPGDLPIVQPAKFELIINLRTAKALGVEVPPLLLARADGVIE